MKSAPATVYTGTPCTNEFQNSQFIIFLVMVGEQFENFPDFILKNSLMLYKMQVKNCFRIQIQTWHPIQLHWGMFHSGQRPGTSPEARCTISIQKHRKQSKKMQIQTRLASSSSRRNSIIEDNLCFSDLQLYLIFVCKLKSLEILQFSQIPKFDNRIFSWCSQVVS